jgi:hypothetical protein
MIWSVSTLTRSSGATRPVCTVKGFILQFLTIALTKLCHFERSRIAEGNSAQSRNLLFPATRNTASSY